MPGLSLRSFYSKLRKRASRLSTAHPPPLPEPASRPPRSSSQSRPGTVVIHDDDAAAAFEATLASFPPQPTTTASVLFLTDSTRPFAQTAAAAAVAARGAQMYLHSTISAPNLRRSAELAQEEAELLRRAGSRRSRASVGRLSRIAGYIAGGPSTTPSIIERDESFIEDNDQRERREAYEQLQRTNLPAGRQAPYPPPRTSSATSPPLRSRAPSACSSKSSSSSRQLSKMAARLDAQLGALGSVFARIRTNASLKQITLATSEDSPGDSSCSETDDTHTDAPCTLQRPAIPRSASTSALTPTNTGAPGTAPYRVDSGFARSELDLLYADLMSLSLSQFSQKHATSAIPEEDEKEEEEEEKHGHAVVSS
ncbi:hypothetical protein BDZ88DRAFT_155595 [Geranomyces variabilis]|nr:hypothetical protein BDZ88DRAFT_155595 [Geranomyces variabilis]KAJ3140483.1 hypothetical protein HDU90_007781 [Geranomyces variabilis]